MHGAFELVHTFEVRDVPLGSEAGRNDQEARLRGAAVCCLDGPLSRLLREVSISNHSLESARRRQAEHVVNMVEVGLQLIPPRVVC